MELGVSCKLLYCDIDCKYILNASCRFLGTALQMHLSVHLNEHVAFIQVNDSGHMILFQ